MKKILLLVLLLSCQQQLHAQKGHLFIIGGGKIDDALMRAMVAPLANQPNAYAIIIPLASEEPDSASYFAQKRFERVGFNRVAAYFKNDTLPLSRAQRDSLQNASLVYFTGGDQERLMRLSRQLDLVKLVHEAYTSGAVIAGTSAGAAIMSQKMLTGAQRKVPYEETFSRLEANNVVLDQGYGFLSQTVIDQHFIKRSRYNRLISVVIENPKLIGVGIDESTAIWVHRGKAKVVGNAQVVVFKNKHRGKNKGNLLRAKRLHVSVFTDGDVFAIK